MVYFTPATWLAVIECVFFGFFTAAIGFNVMHDGGHGSFSKSKSLNKMAAISVNFLGASSIMWNMKHNIIHHTYTNIHGVDDDIEARPLLRLCDEQTHYKIHKYQHLYFWAAYSLLYLYWIFVTDYKKYFLIGASPEDVYKALTNPATIQLWTGEKAIMSEEPGSEFSLWEGSIEGINLEFISGKKIVQQWFFGDQEEPSIVTIILHEHRNGTSAELRHINIPDEDYDNILSGWEENYFGSLIDFYED